MSSLAESAQVIGLQNKRGRYIAVYVPSLREVAVRLTCDDYQGTDDVWLKGTSDESVWKKVAAGLISQWELTTQWVTTYSASDPGECSDAFVKDFSPGGQFAHITGPMTLRWTDIVDQKRQYYVSVCCSKCGMMQ